MKRCINVTLLTLLFILCNLSVVCAKEPDRFDMPMREKTNLVAIGEVKSIQDFSFSIEHADSSDDDAETVYTFLAPDVRISSASTENISISDLRLGERVLVEGRKEAGQAIADRVIILGEIKMEGVISTSTKEILPVATSTDISDLGVKITVNENLIKADERKEEISTSTILEISTSTTESTSTPTSTPIIIDATTSTDVILNEPSEEVINTTKDSEKNNE